MNHHRTDVARYVSTKKTEKTMARKIEQIMQQLLAAKEQDETLRERLTSTSKTAIWRLLLYIVAVGTNVVESLWDAMKADVDEEIDAQKPHRLKWYRDKALAFMYNMTLPEDSDTYDTTGTTDDQRESRKKVKFAAVEEMNNLVIIKVAKGDDQREPLDDTEDSPEFTLFKAYMQEIKDAGVRLSFVNQAGDAFSCALTVLYAPVLLESEVRAAVRKAIKSYIRGLPFNGLYTNMSLIDAVQAVDGVKIAELVTATAGGATVSVQDVPQYGYYNITDNDITVNAQPYAQ